MKKWISGLLAMMLLLAGCDSQTTKGDTILVYYLRDIKGSIADRAVEPVEISAPHYSDKAGIAMRNLLSNPKVDGLVSPFPKGVSLESITYDGDLAVVSLSGEYGEMYGPELAAADACTTMTLCNLEGISAVRLTVNGQPHPAHDKEFLSLEDVVVDDLSLKPVSMEAVLFFSNGRTEYVVPEMKNIVIRENESIERYVMEELIKGPINERSEDGYQPILNKNTEVISITTENKICSVNLSSEFLDGFRGNRALEIQTLFAITNSLCAIEGVDGVHYLVEGEPVYGNAVMRENETVIGAFFDPSLYETLYFADPEGNYLEPVPTRIEAIAGLELERLIVEKMITGIDGYGFLSMLPKGTLLRSIEIERNTCILNFSDEFIVNYDGKIDREILHQAIVLSLVDANENIENVRFLIDGNPLNGGVPIYPVRSVIKQPNK